MEREQEMLERFRIFGPDVILILQRVFKRYGHFKPLLTHMKLVADGNLVEQEDTLHRIISRYGVPTFIEAVEIGTNPAQLMRKAFETPMEEYVNNPPRGEAPRRISPAPPSGKPSSSHCTPSTAATKMRSLPTPTMWAFTQSPPPTQPKAEPIAPVRANIPGTPGFVERRKNPDRRKNSPGRRQVLTMGFPDDRRENGCRRKAQRRANG